MSKARKADTHEGLTAKEWAEVAGSFAVHLLGLSKQYHDNGAYLLAIYGEPPWYAPDRSGHYAAVCRVLRACGATEPTEDQVREARAQNIRPPESEG